MARILLIDPEPSLLKALEASPVLAGHELTAAAGDVDALRRLRSRAFDVVVTNPSTTVEEDLALLDEIRRTRRGVRIIVLTDRASRQDVVGALSARVFAVFSKPFDPDEIAAMVSGAVASPPGHDGIVILSAVADWVAVRLDCSLITAERLLRFISELQSEVPGTQRGGLLIAYREVLLSAIGHGSGLSPWTLVDVAAIRTERSIVFYVKHPGYGFDAPRLPAGILGDGTVLPGLLPHDEASGRADQYRLLVARTVVDEMFYSEGANEVVLVKYTR